MVYDIGTKNKNIFIGGSMLSNFNGLGLHLGNLPALSNAVSRSINAENLTGAKGQGGMATNGVAATAACELGHGWKINPCLILPGRSHTTLADIEGPGAIQHIWITVFPTTWRSLVLRIYWDGEETPSVETPLGDFFCSGWGVRCNITSLPVSVNPAGGFNSYWEMPFRKHARLEIENLSPDSVEGFFFQVDYTLTDVPAELAYFHAQWRRSNHVPYLQVLQCDLMGTHIISKDTTFIKSIITGIITTIARFTNKDVFVRLLFALSKRNYSSFCVLNALMTIMPERPSLIIRLRRSIRFCITLNFGMVIEITKIIKERITITATAIIQDIEELFTSTRIIPPIPRIGA